MQSVLGITYLCYQISLLQKWYLNSLNASSENVSIFFLTFNVDKQYILSYIWSKWMIGKFMIIHFFNFKNVRITSTSFIHTSWQRLTENNKTLWNAKNKQTTNSRSRHVHICRNWRTHPAIQKRKTKVKEIRLNKQNAGEQDPGGMRVH